ncbi:integral membrane protein [Streptomyces sviceus ATCC 29083]|uniref:Integral membrane protein n=1 Tax=Streptomyces sviceus (strain ATCC 29083 / DSM 924 / JCM 4929 / NBRC 13980 / NCIMB 11184 / NRRL 5439 / UC 5370) TaxID=463191 RepID=B5HZH2_STRX2|nr:integral membrane protein [Streptomyces sviceus ATCC 29083]
MNATTTRGSLLATFACVLVGASFTANSLLGDYPYAGGQFLRYGLAALLLVPLAAQGAAARLRALEPRQWTRLALLAGVGMVGFNLAVIAAERTAEPAVPGVFVGCAPVLVAVLVPLLEGRRPRRRVLRGASLVALGAFAVQGWGRTDGVGIAFSVCALAGEVGFAVLAVPVLRPLGPRLLSATVCAVAAVEAAVAGLLLDGTAWLRRPGAAEAGALLWQAAVVTVVGFVCWYMGVQRIGAERATLFSGLIPVAAAGTAPLVGTGSYGAAQAVGSALVGAGVALGSGALSRERRVSAAAVEDDPSDQSRVVVHRAVAATGQPYEPGPGNDLLGPHALPTHEDHVPGAPGDRDRQPRDVVGELDGGTGPERLVEPRGLREGERLGDHGLG